MKWLVTGASGFVGRALVARLAVDASNEVCAAVRSPGGPLPGLVRRLVVAELGPETDWTAALQGVEVVVHLAARVHVMREKALDPLAEFRRVNAQATLQLARQAAQAGVRRFVFVSSVKVNGESTLPGAAFGPDDPPRPVEAYSQSKLEAEAALRGLARSVPMEVVVIRPPLVYGPGVQANFRALMQAVASACPLPLGAIHNRRSFLALDNLVDLLVVCAGHPAAANQVFMASDGCDLSTTELMRRLGRVMQRPVHLWPVPAAVLHWAAWSVGRRAMIERLCGNLQVDISKTRALLDWTPPVSVDEGLRRAANAYLRGPG